MKENVHISWPCRLKVDAKTRKGAVLDSDRRLIFFRQIKRKDNDLK